MVSVSSSKNKATCLNSIVWRIKFLIYSHQELVHLLVYKILHVVLFALRHFEFYFSYLLWRLQRPRVIDDYEKKKEKCPFAP